MENGQTFDSGSVWCAVFHSEEYNWGLGDERWSLHIPIEVIQELPPGAGWENAVKVQFERYFGTLQQPMVKDQIGWTLLLGDGSVPPEEAPVERFIRGFDLVRCLVLAG